MALIQEYGFTVEPSKEDDFQTWLRANESKIADATPGGIRYLGSFGVAFSSEKGAGSHRLLWEFDNYASIDTFSDTMKQADSDFSRLVREYFAFIDDSADSSLSLYRAFVDMWV